MDAGIELFIKESFIDHKSDTFRESFEVFKRSNLEDHENEFNALLMEEGSLDKLELLSCFEDLISTNLSFILAGYGIKVTDEAPIDLMNSICRGLTDVEYYLDPTEMLRIIESDLDIEEKLSDILQAITGIDAQLILINLFKVSQSLIDKIQEVFCKNAFESKETLEKRAAEHLILNDLSNVARYLSNDNLIGFNLIKVGVLVNCEFLQYLKYFERHLDDMKPQELAKELFVLIKMSSDGNKNVLMTYSKHSAILFHELDKISKVYSELNNLINLFDRYMLQRSSLIIDKKGKLDD